MHEENANLLLTPPETKPGSAQRSKLGRLIDIKDQLFNSALGQVLSETAGLLLLGVSDFTILARCLDLPCDLTFRCADLLKDPRGCRWVGQHQRHLWRVFRLRVHLLRMILCGSCWIGTKVA